MLGRPRSSCRGSRSSCGTSARRAASEAGEPVETSYRYQGGISEFVEFLAPDSAVTDTWRLHGLRHVHRDRAGAAADRRDGADRGRARMPGRHRAAMGDRLRHRVALVREHHRDAEGRHASAGLRAGPDEGAACAGRPERPSPEGRQRQAREGRHPRRHDRGAHGAASRAAVRGADERGPRHARGAPDRQQCAHAGADGALHVVQARRQDPDGAAARQGRRRDEGAYLGAHAQRDAAAQERPRVVIASREARGLPIIRCRALRAVHRRGRLGSRHRQTGAQQRVPGTAAHPRQDPQRAEGVGERHALQRGMRLDHPGDRRRIRPLVRPRCGALRQSDPDERRRRRRRAYPHAAADAVLPLHAARSSRPGGCSPRCRRCTA